MEVDFDHTSLGEKDQNGGSLEHSVTWGAREL